MVIFTFLGERTGWNLQIQKENTIENETLNVGATANSLPYQQEKALIVSGKFWLRGKIALCRFPERDLMWRAGTTLTTAKRGNLARPAPHLSMGKLPGLQII